MTKVLCDRCEKDITRKTSARVLFIPDADEEGNGEIEHRFDLCLYCYKKIVSAVLAGPGA